MTGRNPKMATRMTALASVMLLASSAGSQPANVPPPTPDALYSQTVVEVLTRGPVHEAFAEALVNQPQATPLLAKQPPPPVEELPSEQKPAGNSVQWIPGYWAWDDDRSDYIWVSGFWRTPPPDRQWVPGHWH